MSEIILKNICKEFDGNRVVKDVNVTIEDGSFAVLVGPSGCGKSTILRMIAGLEKPTSGEIIIDGKVVNEVPPGQRDIAMVFQNYAIYPTMNVRKNIEFGLINRKVPKKERDEIIEEMCEIVGLTEYLDRMPGTLSGGQRQRVALARAMVKKPSVFLMDEPLSNLDAKLRNEMRVELIRLHKRLKTTFIYVTHDQVEAMSMGSDIIVLNDGLKMQHADALTVYNQPENLFTAQFIGSPSMNIYEIDDIKKVYPDIKLGCKYIGFRPEHIQMYPTKNDIDGTVNFKATVETRELLGYENVYDLKSNIGQIKIKDYSGFIPNTGQEVNIYISKEKVYYFDDNKNLIKEIH